MDSRGPRTVAFAGTSSTGGNSSSGAHAGPEEAGTDQEKSPWFRHGGDAGTVHIFRHATAFTFCDGLPGN
jgi:hypothetical protein